MCESKATRSGVNASTQDHQRRGSANLRQRQRQQHRRQQRQQQQKRQQMSSLQSKETVDLPRRIPESGWPPEHD